MKLLCYADAHGIDNLNSIILKTKLKYDYIVFAGDLGENIVNWKFVRNLPMINIYGNHDDVEKFKTLPFWLPDYEMKTFGGLKFLGINGNFAKKIKKPHHKIASDVYYMIMEKALNPDVVVSHEPPYGSCDFIKRKFHGGSTMLASLLLKLQPKLWVCGHLYSDRERVSKINNTTIINTNKYPIIVDISSGGIKSVKPILNK